MMLGLNMLGLWGTVLKKPAALLLTPPIQGERDERDRAKGTQRLNGIADAASAAVCPLDRSVRAEQKAQVRQEPGRGTAPRSPPQLQMSATAAVAAASKPEPHRPPRQPGGGASAEDRLAIAEALQSTCGGGGSAAVRLPEWFRAECLVGRGAYGAVFLGWDMRASGRWIALKVTDGRTNWHAFVREADALAALQPHPHVARVIAMGHGQCPRTADATLWMAMAPCTCSLAQVLAGAPPPPRGALLRVVAHDVLAALAHIHGLGMLHRDVRPENVLIEWTPAAPLPAERGRAVALPAAADSAEAARLAAAVAAGTTAAAAGGPTALRRTVRVRLCDFGLAKDWRGRALHSNPVGTLPYRAPEVLAGWRTYGAGADIWALGVCLLDVACGQRALPAHTEEDLATALLEIWGVGAPAATLLMPLEPPCAEGAPPAQPQRGPVGGLGLGLGLHYVLAVRGQGTAGIGRAGSAALALMDSMLAPDPRRRPGAAALLRHPFFVLQHCAAAGAQAPVPAAARPPCGGGCPLDLPWDPRLTPFPLRRAATPLPFARHSGLYPGRYRRMIERMAAAAQALRLTRCSFAAAADILDRYITWAPEPPARRPVCKRDAQPLAAACLFLAASYHEGGTTPVRPDHVVQAFMAERRVAMARAHRPGAHCRSGGGGGGGDLPAKSETPCLAALAAAQSASTSAVLAQPSPLLRFDAQREQGVHRQWAPVLVMAMAEGETPPPPPPLPKWSAANLERLTWLVLTVLHFRISGGDNVILAGVGTPDQVPLDISWDDLTRLLYSRRTWTCAH